MGSFTVARRLEGDPKQARALLDDFANIASWSSKVVASKATNKKQGVGAERRCEFDADGKMWLQERLIAKDDKSITVSILDGAGPMRTAVAVFLVEGNVVSIGFRFKMKWGILGSLMGLLMAPMLKKRFGLLLADLDAASGAPPTTPAEPKNKPKATAKAPAKKAARKKAAKKVNA